MSTSTLESTLAKDGGAKAVTVTSPPRVRWGAEEKAQVDKALDQASLFYWNGPQTKLLIEKFQEHYPLEYVMPCSSGTAAIHIAVNAAGVGPGDEVITAPITDMGTVIGILYQLGVPVFADLKPHTYNLDPEDVRRKITPKTKAVIAVHLAGNPADLSELRKICDEHNLVLIEDCAQAWGAEYDGKPVGTIGDIGCWSLNDFKHIGCGDGGVAASSHPIYGPLLNKCGDKHFDRVNGTKPTSLAPNYRITELQSAVAAVQLDRMRDFTEHRGNLGRILNELLQDVEGIHIHEAREQDRWTCWFYMLRIDPDVLGCDAKEFSAALNAEGASNGAGYIGIPVYKFPMFANHSFFNGSWPVRDLGLTEMDYTKVCCPVTEEILNTCIQIGVNESTPEEYARQVADAVRKVAAHFRENR
jgi:dTDP-4-amino-4,6-dideoxygalactose transaminase